MIRVSQITENIVKESPFLEESLSQGITNYTALAKKIKPQIRKRLVKDVKMGAIVMSLRRLKVKLTRQSIEINKVLSNIDDMVLRTNLIEYTFLDSESLFKKIKKFINYLSAKDNVFWTITQGVFETSVIISIKVENKMISLFKGEKIISLNRNLCSITLRLPVINIQTSGVYYTILKALALEGINIIEIVSTSNELTLFFNDVDLDKALTVLKTLNKTSKQH